MATFASCVLCFTGCDGEDIIITPPQEEPIDPPAPPTPPAFTLCEVPVAVDWTAFGDAPTTMTLLFYPKEGSAPIQQVVNRSDSAKVDLPVGTYHVVLFNGKAEDFATIGFRGMDKYETAELYIHDIETKADSANVVHNPEQVGLAKLENFEVTEAMLTKAETPLIQLAPNCVDATTAVEVRIEGIHNLEQVTGMMAGMAESFFIATGKTGKSQVSHIMDDWKIVPDANDPTIGWIKGNFASFGLPTLDEPIQPEEVQLHISLKVKDQEEPVTVTHHVGNLFEEAEEGEKTEEGEEIDMKVEITIPVTPEPEEPDTPDTPDTPNDPNKPGEEDKPEEEKPEEDKPSYNPAPTPSTPQPENPGFGAGVDEWEEDETENEVEVKNTEIKQNNN